LCWLLTRPNDLRLYLQRIDNRYWRDTIIERASNELMELLTKGISSYRSI